MLTDSNWTTITLLSDVDNNGFLDDKDFECMAVRAAVIEGKGAIKQDRMDHYKNLMTTLWQEISDIADEDRVMIHLLFFLYMIN